MSISHTVDDGDLRGQSIRGASALLVGQIFRFSISMVSQVYLARLLFPSDFGIIAMVYPVMGFVQLFADLGLTQAVVQRRQVSQALLSAVFWINASISFGLSIVFALMAPLLVFIYHEPRVGPVTLVLSVMILVSGLSQVQGALLNRELKFVAIVAIDISALLAGLAAGIIGVHHGLGYWSLVVSQIAATCTSTLLTAIISGWRPSLPRREREAIDILRFGGQITGSRVVNYFNATADNMMVGAVLGKVSLGIYDRAWRLAAQPLQQLCAPVDRLAVPILSRLQDDAGRYQRAFGQMIQLLTLLAMPGLLYGVVAADRFIPVLLGSHWLATIEIFRWVCIGALISPMNNASNWLFTSQGRGGDALRYSFIASTINVTAYAVGLIWGLLGVARCSALSVYLLQWPIIAVSATAAGPVNFRDYLRAALPGIAGIALAAWPLYLLTHHLPQGSIIAILFGGACSYLFVGAALACFPAGRSMLRVAWKLLPDRFRPTAINPLRRIQ